MAIKKTDIFADDLFHDVNVGAEHFLKLSEEIQQSLKENLRISMEFLKGWKVSGSESIKERNVAMAQSNSIMEESLKIEIQAEKVEQARIKTKKDQLALQNAVSKAMRTEVKDKEKLNNLYKQESARLNDLRNAYKNLAIQGRENGKVGRALLKDITETDAKLKKIDASVGQFQRNVGNYTKGISGLGRQIRSFGGELLGLAGIVGGTALFTNAIKQIGEFDQSLADLRAILGLTADSQEFIKLQNKALELGKTTTASASEVVEAYKLIGSAKPELLENVDLLNKTTEAAITLSDASGLALPDAATRLTDALNQFNLSGKESERVINVLAAGAKFGSAEIPQVTDALLQFGTIAKNANVSIEESVGIIEAFAERGLKGAEAGTKLRNVLLNLSAAKALPKEAIHQLQAAGVNIDIISNNSLTLEERLRELSKIQGNQTAIVKVFGKENAAAGNILLDNIDAITDYTQKVTDTTTAQEQAAERTDTLQGSLKKLSNAWQAAVIEFGQGGGDIKGVIDFIRENLSTIIAVVVKVAKTFIVYKGTVLAVQGALKVAQVATQAYAFATKALTAGLDGALKSFKALDSAMKANVIGAVVAGLYTLIDSLGVFKSAADLAAESQERINSAISDHKELIDKSIQGYKDLIIEIDRATDREIKLAQARGEKTAKIEQNARDKKKEILEEGLKNEEKLRGDFASKAADLEFELISIEQELAEENISKLREIALRGALQQKSEELAILNGKIDVQRSALKDFGEDVKDINNDNVIAAIDAQNEETTATKAQLDKRKELLEKAFQNELDKLERERIERNIVSEKTITDNAELNIAKLESDQIYFDAKIKLEEKFQKDAIKTQEQSVVNEKKINDEKLKLTQERLAKEREAFEQVRQLEIDIMDDGRQKDKAQARADIANRIEQLRRDGKLTAEIETLEYEKLRKELLAIDAKYDQQEIDAVNEELAKIDAESEAELKREEERLQAKAELRKQYAEKFLGFVEQELQREGQLREQAINQNIDRIQREINRQEELAAAGRDNMLAFKEQELAQEQLRLEEEKKKQIRNEKTLAFFKLVAGYADKEPQQAVRLALIDVALMTAAQAFFARGKENIQGPGSTTSDSIPAMISRGESVVTATGTEDNPGLATAMNKSKEAVREWFLDSDYLPRAVVSQNMPRATTDSIHHAATLSELRMLREEINSVKKVLKNRPVTQSNMDQMGNVISKTIQEGFSLLKKQKFKKPRI